MDARAPMKLENTTARHPGAPSQVFDYKDFLIDKQGDHGVALDDAFERLGQQRRAGQLADLAAGLGRVRQRDGVRDDQLVQRRVGDAVDRRARQHRVGAIRDHFLGAALLEHFGGLDQRTGGVNHIVHDDAIAAFDFTDDVHHFGDIGFRTALVDDGQVAAEAFRQRSGADHAADVGRDHQQVLVIFLLQVAQQDRRGVNIVDRDIEEALDLVGVQVHDQDALDAGFFQHVGDDLGRDGDARRTWAAVLAGVTEVRDGGGDAAGRSPFQRVNHQDQFHQAVVGGCAGRLQHEDVFTADVFVDFDHDLAVREF